MKTIEVEKRGAAAILILKKDMVGGQETWDSESTVNEIVAGGCHHIVVDLGKISHISSLGIGALTAAYVRCRRENGWLRLARVGKRIKNIFLITKLVLVFATFESVEEALSGSQKESV